MPAFDLQCSLYSSKVNKFNLINYDITTIDHDVLGYVICFNFSTKIKCINLPSVPNIEFVISDNNCLLGLNIKILKSDIAEALDDSKRIADKIANFISLRTMQHVTVRKTGHHGIPKPGRTAPVSKSQTYINKIEGKQPVLELGYLDFTDVVKLNELQHSSLQRLSKSIMHLNSRHPVEALKELYALIENDRTFPNFDKYHGLRQIFVHPPRHTNKPYEEKTIKNFTKYFSSL